MANDIDDIDDEADTEGGYVSAPLLSIGDAAKYLGVDRKTVYRLVEWGEVRAVKVGRSVRIEKKSLDQFRESGKLVWHPVVVLDAGKQEKSMSKVLVSYFSVSGNTRTMAESIKEGLDSCDGIEAYLKTVDETTVGDLRTSEGIIVGSPTHLGGMATQVKSLLDRSMECYGQLMGKVGGAFTSFGAIGAGAETTLINIVQALLMHGMVIQGGGKYYAPVSHGAPDAGDRIECVQYGQLLGRLVVRLKAK
jgi:NAD(P)H dehydrogenase (quinone)